LLYSDTLHTSNALCDADAEVLKNTHVVIYSPLDCPHNHDNVTLLPRRSP
jgi:hypothetical protein